MPGDRSANYRLAYPATIFLLCYSLLVTPAFEQRYLASSAPALAMAVALALFYVPLPRRKEVAAAVLLVLVMLLSSGAWVRYHQTWAKSGWLEVAQAVQAKQEAG